MRARHLRTGRSAEILAAAELGRRGYRVIASNYRCREGEIDLVADEGGCIVFVEVRCRRSRAYGEPAASITPEKMRKLGIAAERFLEERGLSDAACRFDVVEVEADNGKLVVASVIRDAFTL